MSRTAEEEANLALVLQMFVRKSLVTEAGRVIGKAAVATVVVVLAVTGTARMIPVA